MHGPDLLSSAGKSGCDAGYRVSILIYEYTLHFIGIMTSVNIKLVTIYLATAFTAKFRVVLHHIGTVAVQLAAASPRATS